MKINYHSIHVLLVCTRAYQPECGTITGIPHIHTLVLSLVLIIMETGSLLVSYHASKIEFLHSSHYLKIHTSKQRCPSSSNELLTISQMCVLTNEMHDMIYEGIRSERSVMNAFAKSLCHHLRSGVFLSCAFVSWFLCVASHTM